jgi:hypothetical protein
VAVAYTAPRLFYWHRLQVRDAASDLAWWRGVGLVAAIGVALLALLYAGVRLRGVRDPADPRVGRWCWLALGAGLVAGFPGFRLAGEAIGWGFREQRPFQAYADEWVLGVAPLPVAALHALAWYAWRRVPAPHARSEAREVETVES